MPAYDYVCQTCGGRAELRRRIPHRDAPAECECGGEMLRQFTPNGNIVVPTHFRAVREGGVEGGYSWSDFHGDRTEKELARLKETPDGRKVEVVPYRELMSQSGAGTGRTPPAVRQEQIGRELSTAFSKARQKVGPPPSED